LRGDQLKKKKRKIIISPKRVSNLGRLTVNSCLVIPREEITLEISDLEAGGQEAGGQQAGGQEAGGQEPGGQEAGGLDVKWKGTTEAGRRITRRGVKARCSS
jgi:hypothetical protein